MQLKPTAMILLAVVLFFAGTLSAFAVQFADINEAPWAKPHIERMAEKGIVSGSDHPVTGQRVYRPNSPVTKVESLVLLYSILQKTNQLTSATDYSNKYQSMLTAALIPDWAKRQVGYALETGIITTGDLAGLMRAGTPDPLQNNALREEVAVYFGRSLDRERTAQSGSISLGFLDTESISSEALPYVQYLVRKRIISGDNENRFNPRATIIRAEMAALSNKTYDVLMASDEVMIDLVPITSDDDAATSGITRREGVIQRVNQETGILFVLYEDEDEIEIHQVTDNTIIRINSLPHQLINLRQGQEAEFTFNDRKELLRIEISPHRVYYQGKIVQMVDLLDYYAITIEDSESERRSFQVDSRTEIIINGVSSTIRSLNQGDQVRIEYDGQRALMVEKGIFTTAQGEEEIDGILESTVNFNRTPYTLQVRLLNNRVTEYQIDESVAVRIDGERALLEELTKGDIVTIRIDPSKGNRITRIEALGLERTRKMEGTIDTLIIGRNVEMRFTDKNRNEFTFTVAEGARVYIENKQSGVLDLKMPAEATIYLEGDLVVEIEASRAFSSQVIQGRITSFRDSINMMTVRHLTSSGIYETISVYVTAGTMIIDQDGREIRIRDLATNAEVFVTGVFEGDAFIADRVLVIRQ